MLTVTAFIGLMAGQVLNSIEAILIDMPVILFLLPLLNGLGGNIGTVLGARLSSGFHSGYIELDLDDVEMRDNIRVSLALGGCIYLFFALVIGGASLAVPVGIHALRIFTIIIGTGLLLTLAVISVTLLATFWSYRKGLDPDNIVVPVVTTMGDFLGIGILVSMVWLVI